MTQNSPTPSSVVRGGYGVFYEKQWIDRFDYLLNRVFTNSYIANFGVSQIDPGPSNGQFPTNPFLVNGPTVNRALVDQVVPPGTLARNTAAVWLDTPGSRAAAAAAGLDRLRAPTRATVVDRGRLRAHGKQ